MDFEVHPLKFITSYWDSTEFEIYEKKKEEKEEEKSISNLDVI